MHLCDCVVVGHGESLVVGDEDGGDLDVVVLDVLVDALLVADRQRVPRAAGEITLLLLGALDIGVVQSDTKVGKNLLLT